MSAIPSFSEGQIEALARLLGECGSGTDITRVLTHRTALGQLDALFASLQQRAFAGGL